MEKIEKLGYGYIVYNVDKAKQEIKVVKEFDGKKNKTENKNINCQLCKSNGGYKDDEYLEALEKFYREQRNEGN